MSLKTVNPGELIKSLDWNELVAAINSLDMRVTDLESGGPGVAPHITQVLPAGPVTAGDTIRIYGSHFDYLLGGQSVFFGTTRAVSFLDGSSDTLLIVIVPNPVTGATEPGTAMTLTVGNLVATTTQAITVKSKPVVVTGVIQFSFNGTRPTATPTKGAQFFYDFDLKSQASEDLTVTITPEIAVVQPLPGGMSDPDLPALVTLLDADQSERPSSQVSLPEGTTKTISLRLNVPANSDGLKYSLKATASAPGVAPKVENLPPQQVGVAGELPDSTIEDFDFQDVADGDAEHTDDTGGKPDVEGTIKVKASSKAVIEMNVTYANIPLGQTKHYQVDAAVLDPVNGWSAIPNADMENPQTVPGPGGAASVFVDINAPGAATEAVLKMTLTRTDGISNNKRSVAYRLILK